MRRARDKYERTDENHAADTTEIRLVGAPSATPQRRALGRCALAGERARARDERRENA